MIKYGLTIENQKLISSKAKSKNNGVYQFRGVVYRVLDGDVTHYAACGDIMERAHGFNVIVGSYPGGENDAKKILRAI